MHWRLGAKQLVSKHGDDFVAWRWWVHREDGDYSVEVRISRSVIAAVEAEGDVSKKIYEAVKTDGAVALTGFADWVRPPDVVHISTTGITADGGREGPPSNAEICRWMDSPDSARFGLGADVIRVRTHLVAGQPLEVAINLAARDNETNPEMVAQNWEGLRAFLARHGGLGGE